MHVFVSRSEIINFWYTPSPSMFHILNPLAPYSLATWCIDFIIVRIFLSQISLAVQHCISLCGDHKRNFADCHCVNCQIHTSIFSIISLGSCVHVTLTGSIWHLVISPFTELRFGPNMSSTLKISCLVILQLGIILPSTYLVKSSVLGLFTTSCKVRAFLALE